MTVLKQSAVARWIIATSLFVAGSCAPASQGSIAARNAPYDVAEAEKTFSFAYTTIVERHLDRITAATLALEGMRGFGTIDPEIGISRVDGKVLLSASDRVVAQYPAPAEDDAKAWGRLIVTVALDARGVSPKMHDATLEEVYQAAFDSTLSKLDLFSRYAGAKEAREHRASRNGFGGVGIKFEMSGGEAEITDVMEGTPAAKAGLKVGDVITHIDGQPIAHLEKTDISKRLRGPVSSEVGMEVRRGPSPVQVSLRRALIVPPTVTVKVENGIAEFKIASFNQRTASSLSAELKAIQARMGTELKGVVLDMRGNPGGLLDQAVSVVDLFVKEGPIVSTKGRHPLASQSYEARKGDMGENLPVAVLVDGKSASAAEIVASALQDAGRAVVIGTNSYGKGTVQTVIRLPNDGEMTLTWSRFHTPSGYALHGLGVLPSVCTADEKSTEDGLVEGVIRASASTAPVVANLQSWRHTTIDEVELRKRLRATCPSAKHGDSRLDMDTAIKILSDRNLYAHALSLSSPASTPAAAGLRHAPAPQQAEH